MTYITLKENEGAGIGHNSCYINNLIYLVHSKSNLKYLHTPFQHKSKYYDIILQYNKIYENNNVNYENLNKINITNISDFDLNDDNTLLIVDEKMMSLYINNNNLKNKNITNEVNEILIKNKINIRNFLKDDIDYDINSINITLHIRRGDIMKNNKYLNSFKSRYLPNEYYTNILNKLQNLNLGKLKINIVSDAKMSDFENDFKDFNINYILPKIYHSEELKRKTISYLIFNDILVTAPSGFSNISTIYSTGLVINNNIKGILKSNCDVKKKLDLDNMNRKEILNKMKKN